MACNVSGSLGNCANVPANVTDPHTRCGANGICGNTGACNGGGACQQQPTSLMCSDPSCSTGVETHASFCSGAGTCPTATTAPCGDYVCGATACKTGCSVDTDCIGTDYCTGGTLQAEERPRHRLHGRKRVRERQLRRRCLLHDQQLHHDDLSGLQRQRPRWHLLRNRRRSAGTDGTVHDGRDLREHWPLQRRQRLPAGGERARPAARPPATAPTQFINVSTCNGGGSCVPPSGIACGNYVCTTSGCPKTSCNLSTDCVSGYYCDATNHCVPQSVTGDPCTTGAQCPTGFCTNGFCCGTSTCASCYSCGVSGSTGTCTAVLPSGADPTGTCTGMKQNDPTTCGLNGLCNGSGGCQHYSTSTMCGSPTCAAGTSEVTALFCDGAGSCNTTGNLQSCNPLMCDGTSSCLLSCAQDSDCVSGSCDTGTGTCN